MRLASRQWDCVGGKSRKTQEFGADMRRLSAAVRADHEINHAQVGQAGLA
jgi:hypothetical protein